MYITMKTSIEMNEEQVQKDLKFLQQTFNHIHKYYNLSDKEIVKEQFTTTINDLKSYLDENINTQI